MTCNEDINTSLPYGAKFYTCYWEKDNTQILVGCLGILFQIASYPAKRLTRIVILPEFQGLGISTKFVNAISLYYSRKGFKIYGATFHPRLGKYWEKSRYWSEGMYNQRSFEKSKLNHKENPMSFLRDGVKMYRYYYTPQENYDLIYDVIEYNKLIKEISELEDSLTPSNIEHYNSLKFKEQRFNKIFNKSTIYKDINSLSSSENEEYKQKYKRVKRKVLSSSERKRLRDELKASKVKSSKSK